MLRNFLQEFILIYFLFFIINFFIFFVFPIKVRIGNKMDASDQKKVSPALHPGHISWVGARWDGVWEGGVGVGGVGSLGF